MYKCPECENAEEFKQELSQELTQEGTEYITEYLDSCGECMDSETTDTSWGDSEYGDRHDESEILCRQCGAKAEWIEVDKPKKKMPNLEPMQKIKAQVMGE